MSVQRAYDSRCHPTWCLARIIVLIAGRCRHWCPDVSSATTAGVSTNQRPLLPPSMHSLFLWFLYQPPWSWQGWTHTCHVHIGDCLEMLVQHHETSSFVPAPVDGVEYHTLAAEKVCVYVFMFQKPLPLPFMVGMTWGSSPFTLPSLFFLLYSPYFPLFSPRSFLVFLLFSGWNTKKCLRQHLKNQILLVSSRCVNMTGPNKKIESHFWGMWCRVPLFAPETWHCLFSNLHRINSL